jgi:putative hydrolase of the HAD superfamily
MSSRVILWDFDGTLAHRPGLWGGCLIETLDEHQIGHGVDPLRLASFLRDGFPWHQPEREHPELCEPDAWWRHVGALLATAYENVGIEEGRARELASLARARYVDPSSGWQLYADTITVLEQLRAEGWRHAILSNHVPELPSLVDALGLCHAIEVVFTSAATGYEKPNRKAFEVAISGMGRPDEVWMVGDNPIADVAGAEAVGIPAVLVRSEPGAAPRHAADLFELLPFLS